MRRNTSFIVVAALLLLSLWLPACRSSSDLKPVTLTILHTNDIHGALDNAPRLTTAIQQVRREVGPENTLLLDAGDLETGTLYSTLFKGEAEVWFMNHDEYDAMTLGNHEFDRGPDELAAFIKKLNFPVVSSNLKIAASNSLRQLVKTDLIITKNGVRYGLIGLTNSSTPELSSPGPDLTFESELATTQSLVNQFHKEGLNKIIVLSNMGWDQDLKLAAQVPGIAVIIGGHTHTVPAEYPTVVNNGAASTLVVQAGELGKYLGKLTISFDAAGTVQDWSGSQLIPIDDKIEAEAAGAQQLAVYKPSISVFSHHVIAQTTVDLDGDRDRNRSQETNLGDLVADSMLAKASRVQAVLALTTGGGIRASIAAGDISMGNVMEVLPFNNFLVTLDITGEQVRQALENGVSQVSEGAGRFPQIAGFSFVWDPSAATGSRIKSVAIKTTGGSQSLDPAATYRVVTTSFLAGGGDGYSVLKEGRNLITLGDVDFDTLAEYLKAHSPVGPVIEGRIKTALP
jgi:2',3'-cyclic-nucleotide 2'-phosphodiesterase (5'-nucleotidase family)